MIYQVFTLSTSSRRGGEGRGVFVCNKFIFTQYTNLANNVHCATTQFPTLDYSYGWIPLFWFAEEYIRRKITRHAHAEYQLFIRVYTSKCVVLLFSVTLPQANIVATRQVSGLKM